MGSQRALDPLIKGRILLHRVPRTEVDHAIATLGEMSFHSVYLEWLPVPQGGFARFAVGEVSRMLLVVADLRVVGPPVLVERMPVKPQSRRQQPGNGALSNLHGTNQDDNHATAAHNQGICKRE